MPDSADKKLAVWTARFASLLHRPTCQLLREVLGPRPCHLVGGALRDLALGQQARDLDIVVAGDGAAVADRLAKRLGSRSIRVGGRRFAAFRVTRHGSPIDIWDRGSAPLDADLRRRDFTIHSFGLDLHTGAIQDPFSGLDDLARSRLRMTTPGAFADDPLRILRLCRFAAQLEGFRVEPATRIRAREAAQDLEGIASERIRTEIELTLGQPQLAPAAQLWFELRIVPEALLRVSLSPDLHQRLQTELPRALRKLERTAASLPVTERLASARLALLLIELGKSKSLSATAALESLLRQGFVTKALSRQVSRLLDVGTLPAGERQQRWFLHQAGELWPEAVSLSAAMAEPAADANRESADLARAIELATQRPGEIFDPTPLISGQDLQQNLHLVPGAQLGRILAAIRRQQIEATIATRAGALEFAAQLVEATAEE